MIGSIDLEDRMLGRDNNFNLIRMVAALAVIVSHAFPVAYGLGYPEPLEAELGHSLGRVAVAMFFFISGLLVTRSFDHNSSISRWCKARAFRIFPGLCVSGILTAYVGGLLVTTLPVFNYLASPDTASFVIRNTTLLSIQYNLPGVFAFNPYPDVVNGSLWTLFYELAWYSTFAALAVLGILQGNKLRRNLLIWGVLLTLLVTNYFLMGAEERCGGLCWYGSLFVELGVPFVMGMLAWIYRRIIPLNLPIVAVGWAITAFFYDTPAGYALFIATLGGTVLFLAYGLTGTIQKYNRLGDYSYGVYIYAFPVQQAAAMAFPDQEWFVNVAITLPVVMLLAVLSWVWVEKPALRLMQSRAPKPALPAAG